MTRYIININVCFTDREEAVSSPLVESLEKMSIKEETKAEKSKSSDKGVSMKDYLAQKFKPRDEDKALSEVISGMRPIDELNLCGLK